MKIFRDLNNYMVLPHAWTGDPNDPGAPDDPRPDGCICSSLDEDGHRWYEHDPENPECPMNQKEKS